MAGEKTKTGNRARTRAVVKRDQSDAEDVTKKPDTPPEIEATTLHPDTTSPVVHLEAMKASSTAAGGGAPSIEAVFRSIAKELIKGGIVLADTVSEFTSETGEKFKDLLAEAKSEVEKSEDKVRGANKTEGNDGPEKV
jgi:hypothetical protein